MNLTKTLMEKGTTTISNEEYLKLKKLEEEFNKQVEKHEEKYLDKQKQVMDTYNKRNDEWKDKCGYMKNLYGITYFTNEDLTKILEDKFYNRTLWERLTNKRI